jgi:poly-beta-1,6-N-acetyl-D-glucosamine synthase
MGDFKTKEGLHAANDIAAEICAPSAARAGIQAPSAYLPVKYKLALAQGLACTWAGLSWYLALPWINELAGYVPYFAATIIVVGIAILPGYAFAFIFVSLSLDRRPRAKPFKSLPPISILVAAYNEQNNIGDTLEQLLKQRYPGLMEIILIDDGSTDDTVKIAREFNTHNLRIIALPKNGGKAHALNIGLTNASFDLIVTVDADTYMYDKALVNIVTRFLSDPPNTVAVAGAINVKNSRRNWLTKVQEWDYFHGIAVVKRTQSLYQGTLVAQGAFSLYTKEVLQEIGGWPDTVGEDIVLSWDMLKRGYRIGYAENAVVFTNVPETYQKFYQQRRRWARGLIEAFKHHSQLLVRPRLNSTFFYLNLCYPFLDTVYLLFFLPGLIVASFGFYFLAGPMTLAILPLGIANNLLMYYVQKRMFKEENLRVRRNFLGFVFYVLFAQLLMSPASVAGYFAEFFNLRKNWGTK